MVEEIIEQHTLAAWIDSLKDCTNPIDCLQETLMAAGASADEESLQLGCPLNNLAQEMSPVDEGFRIRLEHIYGLWRDGIAQSLAAGQRAKKVRQDIDPAQTAIFIVASLEGCVGMAKSAQSLEVLHTCGRGLIHYLESLRKPAIPTRQSEG